MDDGSRRPKGRVPTREDLDRLADAGVRPGLCATCRNARLLASRSSVFLRCALADVDPAFPRYPRLPVIECSGFDDRSDGA